MSRYHKVLGMLCATAGCWACCSVAGCGGDVQVLDGSSGTGQGGGTGAGSGAGADTATGAAAPVACTLPSERVDLLLAVDDSRAMGSKQALLTLSVPYLIGRLTNPMCVNDQGLPAASQPLSGTQPCPVAGTTREFAPVTDLHVGVVSSSLGDHGGDVCPDIIADNNDAAHLLDRASPVGGGKVPTYQSQGFLAWDPQPKLSPPGESDPAALTASLGQMLNGLGEVGCGLEAPLESWYRFLVDTNPYQTIEEQDGKAVMQGTDQVLLDQRKSFLRPDSLLMIVLLSDENDCSIRDGGQYFYAAKGQTSGGGAYHLPKPQITCATDPNDDCCRSCGQSDSGCPAKGPECDGELAPEDDSINLRCFDGKRRFGIDFLYPIDRYVAGLTQTTVLDNDGNVQPNPLFSDLDPSDNITAVRGPERVLFTAIVGVPWQDIARRNSAGAPDLLAGRDDSGVARGGFQSATELLSNGTWDVVLGDPANYVVPNDPLMRESIDPRVGTQPITGEPIASPSAGYLANSINGHERTVSPTLRDDLQYACIVPLATPVDCSVEPQPIACACADAPNDDPTCQDPSGIYGHTQYFAKAYPGLRELELVKALGPHGVVGSLCAAQQQTPAALDYAYQPAFAALVEAAKGCL